MEERMINGKRYLVWEEKEKGEIETVALFMLEQNKISGLLPFRLSLQGETQYCQYGEIKGESLMRWLTQIHYKKEVLACIRSLIDVKAEIENFLLEENHLYTELGGIWICGNECRMAYIPYVAYRDGNILNAAKYILETVKYARDEDYTYIFELLNAFSRGEIESCATLRKWIRMLGDEGDFKEKSMPSGQGIPFVQENSTVQQELLRANPVFPQRDIAQKKEALPQKSSKAAAGIEKRGRFFSIKHKTKKKEEGKASAVQPAESKQDFAPLPKKYINETEEGETVFFGEADTGYLIDKGTGKEYLLEGNECIVGSDSRLADICIEYNPAVSRRHAKVYHGKEKYEIKDLNSTNGTYVNGERIAGGERRRLENGSRIKLANAEFIFELRRR